MKKSLLLSSTLVTTLTLGSVFILWNRKPIQASRGHQQESTLLSLEAFVQFNAQETKQPNIGPQHWPASKLKNVMCTIAHDVLNDKITLNRDSFTELLIPLVLMGNKEHKLARQLLIALAEQNDEKVQELLAQRKPSQLVDALIKTIEEYQSKEYVTFCHNLLPLLEALDVRPSTDEHEYKRGGYHSYYSDKKEEFSVESQKEWQNKQKNVYKILSELKPKTVLDLGANRGWFSRLAHHLGANVTATDIDESCMDEVYMDAHENQLPIVSTIISFEESKKAYISSQIKSDIVLCLALVHHLVFVAEFTLEQIFENLAEVTRNTLIFEFVELDDEKVQMGLTNPKAFKSIETYYKVTAMLENYGKQNYNLENAVNIGLKFFKQAQIIDSHPSTRKLIVLKK